MSDRLPLFPLDAVLFPGTTLPLHIFEPRYREMIADVLDDDRRFGLLPPGADGGLPAHGALGCVAEITVHQPLPDGRANLLVTGGSRFQFVRQRPEALPYFVGDVEPFGDETSDTLPGDAREALLRLAERARGALHELTGTSPVERWAEDAATLTFQLGGVLPWAPGQAAVFLALRSAAARADLLLQLLPRIVPDLEQRAAVHHRAPTNGKGHHPPDAGDGA